MPPDLSLGLTRHISRFLLAGFAALIACRRRNAARHRSQLDARARRMCLLLTVPLVLMSSGVIAHDKEIPVSAAATRLVNAVHHAAASGAPEALRKFMATDFVSSFGGDGGPDEAIALWNQDNPYLRHLTQSTSGQCQLQTREYLVCRSSIGSDHRAGFARMDGTWLFVSFVAGD